MAGSREKEKQIDVLKLLRSKLITFIIIIIIKTAYMHDSWEPNHLHTLSYLVFTKILKR